MSLRTGLVRELAKGPRTVKQLRSKLGADGKKIQKALKAMEAERQVTNEKGLYALARAAADLVEGRLVKLGRSFGFVQPGDGSADIFVPGHSLLGAMPGDVVRVSPLETPRVPDSREGEVVAIVQPRDLVAGTVQEEGGRLFLVPDNAPDTPLFIAATAGVKPGDKAAGHIAKRGERHDDIRVDIVQRFGSADSARQCAKAILFAAGLRKGFPDEVKAEGKAVAEAVISQEEAKKRADLRAEPIFTIDAASTKDIDDAISAYETAEGYTLCVHIADVSHFVRPGSKLDEEALARGTSIYYADSVIPMLPASLSNGACSLNPGEDRLAFSCIMNLDHHARLVDYRFMKSIIRSRVKGVYSEINELFAGRETPELKEKYAGVAHALPVMQALYQKLAALRAARGAMEIESDEPKLLLNDEGVCVGVEKRTRGDAERMIEEFMLMANTAAAHLARRKGLPFVYRVHDKPAPDRVEALKQVLEALGMPAKFKGDSPSQAELSALLNASRGGNLEIPVHNAVLRSMAKAVYEPEPKGHYGLALADYAHFTSPIRRYPDLAIHRILSDVAAGQDTEAIKKRYKRFAAEAAKRATETELVAVQTERSCDDCYKAEYMKPFVGQSFDGVIGSVTSFGLYVSLPNTVEGLVRSIELSPHRLELHDGVALVEPKSGKSYKVGQPLRVQVAGADVSKGKVDFIPAPGKKKTRAAGAGDS